MSQDRPANIPKAPTRTISYISNSGKSIKGKAYHSEKDLFLKGPVKLNWIIKAGNLQGKTLLLGIYLWFLAGLKRSYDFDINLTKIAKAVGVSRRSLSRAFNELIESGLISADRHTGRKAKISIISDTEKIKTTAGDLDGN